MRDQPLTAEQAARWLECSVEEVQAFVAEGHLKAYGTSDADAISLNSTVVLAESLPVERGVFRVREMAMAGDGGAPGGYGSKPPHAGPPRPQGERGGFVVERRTPGRRI
jgi:hypothetical protein